MRTVEDARRKMVEVPTQPQRIVSIAPQISELLLDLGAGDRVVGVTRRCSHPSMMPLLADKNHLGNPRHLDLPAIVALAPDLVLGLEEENLDRDLSALEQAGLTVYVTTMKSVEDALTLIGELGDLVSSDAMAMEKLQQEVVQAIVQARWIGASHRPLRVFYPVAHDPWITVAPQTYPFDMLMLCGCQLIMTSARGLADRRFPKVDLNAVYNANPAIIILSTEPYRFGLADETHLASLLPQASIIRIDGLILERIGRRTTEIATLARLLADSSVH